MVFDFEDHEIRTVVIENEVWFVGKDVADILGYSNSTDALVKHVDDEDRKILTSQNATLENIPNRGLTIINESGLYSLVLKSQLPGAKHFKRWVTSKVLPSIRKHGVYITEEVMAQTLKDPNYILGIIQALSNFKEELNLKNQMICELKPKAIFADSVETSRQSILVGELAKILNQNGVEIGQNRLFEDLRRKGFLIQRGESRNLPTQRAMDMRLMEIKERTVNNPDGSVRLTKTPKVTGKGQIYFVNYYLSNMWR